MRLLSCCSNPNGRTGVSGRGQLVRWGPNHYVQIVVTRPASHVSGDPLFSDGRPVLEYASAHGNQLPKVCSGLSSHSPSLLNLGPILSRSPHSSLGRGAVFPPRVKEARYHAGRDASDYDSSRDKPPWGQAPVICTTYCTHHCIQRFLIVQSIPDDPRCTDQAWVEIRVLWVHDTAGCLRFFPLGQDLIWRTLCSTAELPDNDRKHLQKVRMKRTSFIFRFPFYITRLLTL